METGRSEAHPHRKGANIEEPMSRREPSGAEPKDWVVLEKEAGEGVWAGASTMAQTWYWPEPAETQEIQD